MKKLNKKTIILILCLGLICFYNPASAGENKLPEDFIKLVSRIYRLPVQFSLSAGGAQTREKNKLPDHYPVIMVPANKRSFQDWLGKNPGNAAGETNVYKKFIRAGFVPEELWLYQYTSEEKEMENIEELTDGLKWFIYSILWYTKSNKCQILAHGEGAVLAQATIKKYNLYNFIHAAVYIAGPFHGSSKYTYIKALMGFPVDANLAVGSDFLQDLNLPNETPYNLSEKENSGHIGIKYQTIYNGLPYGDELFNDNPASPALLGADNYELNGLTHDGLRCAQKSSNLFIPFLADAAIKYNPLYDQDWDGFMSNKHGGADCNDQNPSIFPGAFEIEGDNIDQNCDEMDALSGSGKDRFIPVK